jgi:hypothetical protein
VKARNLGAAKMNILEIEEWKNLTRVLTEVLRTTIQIKLY